MPFLVNKRVFLRPVKCVCSIGIINALAAFYLECFFNNAAVLYFITRDGMREGGHIAGGIIPVVVRIDILVVIIRYG